MAFRIGHRALIEIIVFYTANSVSIIFVSQNNNNNFKTVT